MCPRHTLGRRREDEPTDTKEKSLNTKGKSLILKGNTLFRREMLNVQDDATRRVPPESGPQAKARPIAHAGKLHCFSQ